MMAAVAARCETAIPDPVACSSDSSVWKAIHDPGVALAVWERDGPAGVQAAAIKPSVGNIDGLFALGDLARQLDRAMADAGYAAGHGKAALLADIAGVAGHFARIMAADGLRIRLERVTGNACKYFHADYVTARAICTYAGQGTQWMQSAAAAPRSNGVPAGQLHEGHVGLFKGRLWDPDVAILHRSPPIAGTGQRRLLLVIDPAPVTEEADLYA